MLGYRYQTTFLGANDFQNKAVSQGSPLSYQKAGTYHMWHRTYDPFLGTFTGPDPALQFAFNSHGYAGSNSANYVDPDGRLIFTAALIAGAIYMAYNEYNEYEKHGSFEAYWIDLKTNLHRPVVNFAIGFAVTYSVGHAASAMGLIGAGGAIGTGGANTALVLSGMGAAEGFGLSVIGQASNGGNNLSFNSPISLRQAANEGALGGLTAGAFSLVGSGVSRAWRSYTNRQHFTSGQQSYSMTRGARPDRRKFLGTKGRSYRSQYSDGTNVVQGQQPPKFGSVIGKGGKPGPGGPVSDSAHTRLRWDTVNNRVYQAREFNELGHPVRDIDFTAPVDSGGYLRRDHLPPFHEHLHLPNDPNNIGPSGWSRDDPRPYSGPFMDQ